MARWKLRPHLLLLLGAAFHSLVSSTSQPSDFATIGSASSSSSPSPSTPSVAAPGSIYIESGRGLWAVVPERFQVLFSHALFGAMLLPAFAAVHYVKLGGSACSAYPAGTDFSGFIVMTDRGGCSFYRKAANVQAARGVMMMVANHEDTLFGMTIDPQEAAASATVVSILSVLLPSSVAQRLKALASAGPLAMQVTP